MMKRGDIGESRGTGSVKAAIRLYGDTIFEGSSSLKKAQMDNSEMPYSKARELHKAKRDIGRYKESRAEADSAKVQAEYELRNAKNTARDLSSLLRESASKTREKKQVVEILKGRSARHEDVGGDDKYEEVMRELEGVKQELQMLRLDMAAVLEEKSRAEKRIESSRAKVASCSGSLEAIKKEIEEVNDEQLVVELARIEALRECGDIEAERAKEAVQFSRAIEQTRRKMKDIVDEIEQSKELEPKLAATLADVDVLKHELRQVKEMEKRVRRANCLNDSETSVSLQSVTEELEAAKKELAAVKEEGFQYMASMDIIRNELKHVKSETARLEETQKSRDSVVQNLNSKLLRAKAKLEAVSSAEERANSIASNLTVTLEQLRTEAEAAKRERDLAAREVETIKEEIRKTESERDSAEEKLEAAMRDLEAAKASEDSALENLKSRIESTVGVRAAALQHSSSIAISRFEHEYLTGRAAGADDLADKKVAAAKAWTEAIRANEREIMMKVDSVQREMREMRLEEEKEAYRMERSFSSKRTVERELQGWMTKRDKHVAAAAVQPESFKLGMHKRSMRANGAGNSTPSRRPKFRASASPGGRNSFPIKKKRQVLPSIARLFKGKMDNKSVV